MFSNRSTVRIAVLLVALVGVLAAGSAIAFAQAQEIVLYSGRSASLVAPLIDAFTQETGIKVSVRYGDTAALAATILEEGRNTPADVFWAQDAGALGALAKAGRLRTLDAALLDLVGPAYRSSNGVWVGTSARARVVAYNTQQLQPSDLPESIWGFTDPKWRGKIGWAPTNASLQAFVTALRVLEGDERAKAWLKGIQANEPKVYANNAVAVEAVGRGEIQVAFVNHYYLFRFLKEQGESFPARNYHTRGDAGAMVNVAGVGILDTSKRPEAARQFVEFLLSKRAQEYFANETTEYPVVTSYNLPLHPELKPLDEIAAPDLDLNDLDDLEGTLELMQEVGVL